jgi:prepilin-type processing-associated H-X9-DG protein/prepilin-type N-terminal cleavage/methylation domain-containing protein
MMNALAHGPRRPRKAFTILEVLVVLGIVALLAGFLAPVWAASRAGGRAANCTSNLRQLHHAFSMYATDHGGLLPPYQNRTWARYREREGGPPVQLPDRGPALVQALGPYVRTAAIWFCPEDRFARTASTEGFIQHRYASYRTGIWPSRWLGPLELRKPGTPVTIDATGLSPAVVTVLTDNLWLCDDSPWAVTPPYSHNRRFNYLYFDGHVKAYRRDAEDCPPP